MEEIVYPIAGWWQADNLGRLLHSVSDKTVIAFQKKNALQLSDES